MRASPFTWNLSLSYVLPLKPGVGHACFTLYLDSLPLLGSPFSSWSRSCMLFPLPGISPFLFSIFPFNFVQTLSPLFLRVVCGCSRFPCQRKWLEDNVREWTGLDFAKSRRAMKNRKKKMEETGCEIMCGAPTTLVVKG